MPRSVSAGRGAKVSAGRMAKVSAGRDSSGASSSPGRPRIASKHQRRDETRKVLPLRVSEGARLLILDF